MVRLSLSCMGWFPSYFANGSLLVITSTAKQSRIFPQRPPGLLRRARNDGGGRRWRPSNIQNPSIRIEHSFLHHLRQGRMREHRVHQLFFGRLQVHRDDVALDQLGDFSTDHMGAEELTSLLVEDHLDQ